MSRWDFNNKKVADNYDSISIFWLKKYGYLSGWKSGGVTWKRTWSGKESSVGFQVSIIGDLSIKHERELYTKWATNGEKDKEYPNYFSKYVRFIYTSTKENGEETNYDYKVYLGTTPCYYGGKRYWFFCPRCTERVGVLYLVRDYFTCRHCYNLTYESRNCGYSIVSYTKLGRLRKEIRKTHYRGKLTRKYKSWLKKEQNNESLTRWAAAGLIKKKRHNKPKKHE